MTLIGLTGLILAWKRRPFEAIRLGGVLFMFPLIYYFTHPEPYHMRTLDPLMVMLGCYAVVTLREKAAEAAARIARLKAAEANEVVVPA
jgi:hypothetical protein